MLVNDSCPRADASQLTQAQCCRDPLSQPAPEMSYTKAVEQGALPLPTAVAWTADIGICPVEPEVASLCEKAARWFSSVGASVVDACPDVHDAQELFQVPMCSCCLQCARCPWLFCMVPRSCFRCACVHAHHQLTSQCTFGCCSIGVCMTAPFTVTLLNPVTPIPEPNSPVPVCPCFCRTEINFD